MFMQCRQQLLLVLPLVELGAVINIGDGKVGSQRPRQGTIPLQKNHLVFVSVMSIAPFDNLLQARIL